MHMVKEVVYRYNRNAKVLTILQVRKSALFHGKAYVRDLRVK